MGCIVDGEILSVCWFRDENRDETNINGEYERMLKDHVFPRIRYRLRGDSGGSNRTE